MAKRVILGSSNAPSSTDSENTHMVLVGKERIVMIDCVNNPIHRLGWAGIDFLDETDLILTHFHLATSDGYVATWAYKLLGIYGLRYTLDRMEQLMGMYSWESCPNFFQVAFNRLPETEKNTLLDCAEFRIASSPVRHLIPTIVLDPLSDRRICQW